MCEILASSEMVDLILRRLGVERFNYETKRQIRLKFWK